MKPNAFSDILECAIAAIAKEAEWCAFRANKNVFSAVVIKIAPGSSAAQSESFGSGFLRHVRELKGGAISWRNFQTKFRGDCVFRLPSMQSESSQKPAEANVGRSVAASLQRVRNALQITLQTQVDCCDGIRNNSGTLFYRRSQNFEAFFEAARKKRMFRFFVLGEIGKTELIREQVFLNAAVKASKMKSRRCNELP